MRLAPPPLVMVRLTVGFYLRMHVRFPYLMFFSRLLGRRQRHGKIHFCGIRFRPPRATIQPPHDIQFATLGWAMQLMRRSQAGFALTAGLRALRGASSSDFPSAVPSLACFHVGGYVFGIPPSGQASLVVF